MYCIGFVCRVRKPGDAPFRQLAESFVIWSSYRDEVACTHEILRVPVTRGNQVHGEHMTSTSTCYYEDRDFWNFVRYQYPFANFSTIRVPWIVNFTILIICNTSEPPLDPDRALPVEPRHEKRDNEFPQWPKLYCFSAKTNRQTRTQLPKWDDNRAVSTAFLLLYNMS